MALQEGSKPCPGVTDPSILEKVASIAARWRDRPDMLLPVLHEVQEVAGFIPRDVAETVSNEMRVPLSRIYGVETFYAFFTEKKKGKIIIRLCRTAPCMLKGAREVLDAFENALGIKAGETTPDGMFTLETCECIGACEVSPAARIGDAVYGNLSPEGVPQLISELRKRV